jgi:DNA-3-methyladenine glycosylase II
VKGSTVARRVESNGGVDRPRLAVEVAAPPGADAATSEAAVRRVADYLAVARAFCDVDEYFLASAPVDEVERWLLGIDGIGAWSSAFVLFRGIGRMERMRVTEPFLRAARPVYGPDATDDEIRAIAARYGPWAGYWGLYLRAPI